MIREATLNEVPAWLRLRTRLWPHCAGEEHEKEVREILESERHSALLVITEDGVPCAFVELSLRDYVDGCKSSPVGYIEGIYVEENERRKGIGRALIEEGLRWLASRGCAEVGSDALIENAESIEFHKRIGFDEVERHVVFKRTILPGKSPPGKQRNEK